MNKEKLASLENLAQKLGFEVVYNDVRSWNYSKTSFYPIKKITIGTRNYNPNNINGFGFINDEAKALVLSHEIGHILIYETKYSDIPLEEYCFNNNSEFKIKQEIYAWKVAYDNENDFLALALIQECINEYVFCEYIGRCTINESCIRQQRILTKFSHRKV